MTTRDEALSRNTREPVFRRSPSPNVTAPSTSPATPRESLRRFTRVERSGTQIRLMPFDDPVTTVRGHAAVVVEDYEAALARLHERGFETRPGSTAWGAPRSFVRHPAGSHVELMSAPPPTR